MGLAGSWRPRQGLESFWEWGRTRAVRGRGDRRSPVSAAIALSNQNNLFISESGNAGVLHRPHFDRRHRRHPAHPSGRVAVGQQRRQRPVRSSRSRYGVTTIYIAIGIGDTIRPVAPGSPVTVANPNPASPIFSSVLAIHFSASVERTTAGFSLTAADYDALADGQTVKLSNGAVTRSRSARGEFPDYVPNPLPTVPNSVQWIESLRSGAHWRPTLRHRMR